jgi:cardiolipin synthase A/B
MQHERFYVLMIIFSLCALPSGCSRIIFRQPTPVITLPLPEIYPARVFPLRNRRVCIDMGVTSETPEFPAFALNVSHLAQHPESFAYRNARGDKRFCVCLDILPDMKPGIYDIPITAMFLNGVKAYTHATVEVAKPESAVEDDTPGERTQAALEAAGGSPFTTGNRIEILDNGTQAFTVWSGLLASAGKSIHLQTFYFDENGQTSKLMELLKIKAAQGVDVSLIITRYSQLSLAPLAYLDLKLHGIKVLLLGDIGIPHKVNALVTPWYLKMQDDYRIFKTIPSDNPFSQWYEQQGKGQLMIDYAIHEKMLIVDGKKAIAGGRNLSDCYFFWWQDIDMLLAGPIVDELDQAFHTRWRTFNGDPLPADQSWETATFRQGIPARLVQSQPWDGNYANLDALVSAIDLAHVRVFITSPYLVLPDKLKVSLCAAASRGVDVRILTNSFETGTEVAISLCHFISLNYYRDLLKAGVRIYEYSCDPQQKRKPFVHAKEVILDGTCTAIGSFNLSLRSAYLESELMVYMFDKNLTKNREEKFLADLARHSREIFFPDFAHKEQTFGKLIELARLLEILY